MDPAESTAAAGVVIPEWVATLMGRRELEYEMARAQLVAQVVQLSARIEQLTSDLASLTERLAKAEESAALATLNQAGASDHQRPPEDG